MQTEERVDLQNLTYKELLILMNERVLRIDTKITEYEREISVLKIQLAQLQTKLAVWASLIGFIAGIAAAALSNIIKL